MVKMFPPKGYRAEEYPLPHSHAFRFNLEAEDETLNTTIVPLFRMTEAFASPETVEVNPTNANFAEDPGSACCRGSIIPKVSLNWNATITKGAIETDKMRACKLEWWPIYIAFKDMLDAADEKTGTKISTILNLQSDDTNKDVYPLFVGTNLTSSSGLGLSTIGYSEAFGDLGMDVSNIIESVGHTDESFWDAMQYYTNRGMLRKAIGPRKSVVITRDRPYTYFSNNFTYPTVKRMNPFTFCGIAFHLPQGGQKTQFFDTGDTTAIPHLRIAGHIRFNEWNNAFDQSPV